MKKKNNLIKNRNVNNYLHMQIIFQLKKNKIDFRLYNLYIFWKKLSSLVWKRFTNFNNKIWKTVFQLIFSKLDIYLKWSNDLWSWSIYDNFDSTNC